MVLEWSLLQKDSSLYDIIYILSQVIDYKVIYVQRKLEFYSFEKFPVHSLSNSEPYIVLVMGL